jgi:hypothetical protein
MLSNKHARGAVFQLSGKTGGLFVGVMFCQFAAMLRSCHASIVICLFASTAAHFFNSMLFCKHSIILLDR